MNVAPTCIKCGIDMEEGWIPDASAWMALGFATVPGIRKTFWLRGRPEVSANGQVKWDQEMEQECKDISVYRCPTCGRLDFIATNLSPD